MGSLSDKGERAELDRADREAWDYLLEACASVKSG